MRALGSVIALALLLSATSARAETCPSKQGSQAPQRGEPAATGNDGVGTTDMSGGHGRLSAGTENQPKGSADKRAQPEVAKGLDLKMKDAPKPKC